MIENIKTIFICGCPRSGTTLLSSMLGAAKGCIATPESQFITHTAVKIARREIANTYYDIQKSFSKHFRLKTWGIDQKNFYVTEQDGTDFLADLILQCLNLYASKIGQAHWDTWIDSTPQHIKYFKFLSGLFADSRFIHTRVFEK